MATLAEISPPHPGFPDGSPSPASLTEMISRNKFLEGKCIQYKICVVIPSIHFVCRRFG